MLNIKVNLKIHGLFLKLQVCISVLEKNYKENNCLQKNYSILIINYYLINFKYT